MFTLILLMRVRSVVDVICLNQVAGKFFSAILSSINVSFAARQTTYLEMTIDSIFTKNENWMDFN